MKQLKKTISTILLIAVLAAVSCGENNQADTNPNDSATTSTVEETNDDIAILSTFTPELGEELGLDGYEFNVMIRGADSKWAIQDLVAEEENGDILNDATYQRNMYLEDNFGFTINAGISADSSLTEINTLILAGDDTYDAYFPMGRQAASAAQSQLLLDLNTLQYLDLDADCWNQMFLDSLTFGDKQYYAAGAISTNSYDAVRVFMFNKDLLNDLQLEDPYQLVRDDKWTFDKFNELAVTGASDINGDTVMDLEDQWGMAWQESIGGMIFYFGMGETIASTDENGYPTISVGSERSIEVYDRISAMLQNKQAYYIGADADILTIFSDGRSLFFTEVLEACNRLRSSNVDFGVIPSPKYDEKQENYIQYVDAWCISPIVVPVNTSNADRTGFIIQAMAEASAKFLTDPYYDLVLTGKALRDDESAEMLDIIVNNFVMDSTDMYQWSGFKDTFRVGMANGSDLSSILAANLSPLEAAIEETIDTIG